MYQQPKCPYSYFSLELEFNFSVLFPCEYLSVWFPLQRWDASPSFVACDRFRGNYQWFVVQRSSPSRAITKFWYSAPRFMTQPHELSFMSEKMWWLIVPQIFFVYIFITWNNIYIWFQNFYRKKSVQKESIWIYNLAV